MTESEWLTSTDPQAMLETLRRWPERTAYSTHPEASEAARKPSFPPCYRYNNRTLRLFAVACCRAVWPLLTDPRSRKAVEVAEQYADGLATDEEIENARGNSKEVRCTEPQCIPCMATECLNSRPWVTFANNEWVTNRVSLTTQADLLREIFGNPFCPLPVWRNEGIPGLGPIDDYSINWVTPTVLALAKAAYKERGSETCEVCRGSGETFYESVSLVGQCTACHGTGRTGDGRLDNARLAVLSDALEEAGCEDVGVVAHLRSPGPHVRGCHVLDLVLGHEMVHTVGSVGVSSRQCLGRA